ncbi:hypothetical protein WMF39_43245 [Sorangium sp. So ce1504]|uniref:hypothetical protein n=1 Tax=Sorangium sp. So ce1504 TaxID=3133337 RepID=UPI003F61670E
MTSFGNEAPQTATAVAIDSSGNSYVIGTFDGDVVLGGTVLASSSGADDIFLIKFAGDGTVVWAKAFGNSDMQWPTAIGVDAEENVFFSGITSGPFELNGVSIDRGVFLAKVDSLGEPVWSKHISGLCSLPFPAVHSIVAAGSDGLIVAGEFCQYINFGDSILFADGASTDVFLARIRASDGSGAVADGAWVKVFGDSEPQYGRHLAVNDDGGIVFVGEYYGSVDFGLGALRAADGQDIFVVRFAPDGAISSQRRIGGTGSDFVSGMALDSVGGVLLSGSFNGVLDDMGDGDFEAVGRDGFLLKMDSGDRYQWSLWLGGEGEQLGGHVAIDGDGDIYVQGGFDTVVRFGGAELSSESDSGSVFFAKFSRVGQLSWSRKIDGFSDIRLAGMALTSLGEPMLAGSFSGTIELGTGTLTTNGGMDAFLAKLVP